MLSAMREGGNKRLTPGAGGEGKGNTAFGAGSDLWMRSIQLLVHFHIRNKELLALVCLSMQLWKRGEGTH